MKKFFVLAVIVAIFASMAVASAEDLGVQVIGDNNAATVAVSLDDMQFGTSYTLDGYAVVVPKELKTIECFAQFGEKEDYSVYQANKYDGNVDKSYAPVYCHSESKLQFSSWRYADAAWMDSGESADFVWLLMDVTNLQKSGVEFTEEVTVKVVYQDDYEFSGWIRQIVYDHMEDQNGNKGLSRYGYGKTTIRMRS